MLLCSLRPAASLKLFPLSRCLSIKVAVVGSGPAGFYTSQKLLKNKNVTIDMYEKLPVPFGLVRYGVAPDHADVKNVINSFTDVANQDRVNFYGNVSIGDHVPLESLIEAYHAVVLCYGSAQDKYLGIDGEGSRNTISARNFVGWYNGVPEDKDLDISLDCDTACIIGQGNVALDCARILMQPKNIERTDITTYAQNEIAESKIKRIYIIGRRGPIQTAFTIKELRELVKTSQGHSRLEPHSIFSDNHVTLSSLRNLPRPRRRLTELIMDLSLKSDLSSRDKATECVLKFMSMPMRILSEPGPCGSVRKLELQKTRYNSLESFMDENATPDSSDEKETIDCGLIIRSIGYKPVMVDKSLPVDLRQNSIANTNGKIHGHRTLYCSGWLATGATGVIAGTLNSSLVTAKSILDDMDSNEMPNMSFKKPGFDAIRKILATKDVQIVHFNDWLKIDALEKIGGQRIGKTRDKFVDVIEMLQIARGDKKEQ